MAKKFFEDGVYNEKDDVKSEVHLRLPEFDPENV